jgi:hypothetical protein
MQDLQSRLTNLKRPRLLVRAARIGASNYSRERDLRRVLGFFRPPRTAAAIMKLLDFEYEVNQQRLGKDSGYTLTRHVEILIAIVAEATIMTIASPPKEAETTTKKGSNKKVNGR